MIGIFNRDAFMPHNCSQNGFLFSGMADCKSATKSSTLTDVDCEASDCKKPATFFKMLPEKWISSSLDALEKRRWAAGVVQRRTRAGRTRPTTVRRRLRFLEFPHLLRLVITMQASGLLQPWPRSTSWRKLMRRQCGIRRRISVVRGQPTRNVNRWAR